MLLLVAGFLLYFFFWRNIVRVRSRAYRVEDHAKLSELDGEGRLPELHDEYLRELPGRSTPKGSGI